MAQFDKKQPSAADVLLSDIARRYPAAWAHAGGMRRDRTGLPPWPAWCFLPMGAWLAIADGGQMPTMAHVRDAAILAALGSWRAQRIICRFHPQLYDALAATPLQGDIPAGVLLNLPAWCLYIELPAGHAFDGFFVHLEHDVNHGHAELRLLLVERTTHKTLPIPIHLGQGNLVDAVGAFIAQAQLNAAQLGHDMPTVNIPDLAKEIEPMVSLVLYLCSQTADLSRPIPPPEGDGHFTKLKPARYITRIQVGGKIGPLLQQPHDEPGTHAGPRPHIRRGHWHGYWSGPRSDPAQRRYELRWLPPIPVNFDPPHQDSTT